MHPVERREARAWLQEHAEPGPDNPLPDHVLALLKEQKVEAEAQAQKAQILGEEYGKLSHQLDTAKLIIDTPIPMSARCGTQNIIPRSRRPPT